jgi:hypothetical protein
MAAGSQARHFVGMLRKSMSFSLSFFCEGDFSHQNGEPHFSLIVPNSTTVNRKVRVFTIPEDLRGVLLSL